MRFMALLGALSMVAIVAIACGGGGDDQSAARPTGPGAWAAVISRATAWACSSPSPTAPYVGGSLPGASATPRGTGVLYTSASLPPEDLPEHFGFEYGDFTTNERLIVVMGQLFEEPGSLSVTLEELYCWGRILGYTADYADPRLGRFSGTTSLRVAVDLFRDSGGAAQYFAWLSRDLSNPESSATWKGAQDPYRSIGSQWRDVTASPVSFPPIGDERIAGEMTATHHYPYDPDLDYEYAAKAVVLRSGRLVGTITVSAKNSVPRTKELEDLARNLDERMKDALE